MPNDQAGGPAEVGTRYILEADASNVNGRWIRDVLVYDPAGHREVAVTVPNDAAMDVLEALRRAYQQGRDDHAVTGADLETLRSLVADAIDYRTEHEDAECADCERGDCETAREDDRRARAYQEISGRHGLGSPG